ncbi:hypothetical protein ACELLULO517_07610 [Acidisoma cellulosilytica]|uniref:Uncharacterized protein n=1 Tax=Acidisoma cellulosilyticum TaxID=2802395 RepID=A0A964E3B4_9PROT|nr:hypothetical protein [Acidisoma cellulosilyticum]MCB8880097.1 hypothetical protein [Acidisoma cellulosilyticum]
MSARPITDLLREHRNGVTLDEMSDALQELVAAVTEEGKGGKLTVTITVKPMGRDSGALEVACDIKAAPPKKTPGTSVFFPTPENNLVRQDPRQQSLELREISVATAHKGIA